MSNYLGVYTDDSLLGFQNPAIVPTVTASPYSFKFPTRGILNIAGGTISGLSFVRNGKVNALGGVVGNFDGSSGDIIIITYTVAPVLTFISN